MKRRAAWTLITCLLAMAVQAQEVATTASGKQITVFPDGTWKPRAASPAAATSRPAGASAKLDVNRGRSAVYYDPNKWTLQNEEQGGRTQLQHADGDGYALVIAERVEMSIEVLKKIALQNAQAVAPDAVVVSEEPRKVNGADVVMLQIDGTMSGIAFTYLGYYYTGERGTIQVITFTGRNLFEEFRPDFEEFLNGFVVKP